MSSEPSASASSSAGRFEVPPQKFNEMSGGGEAAVLDLKETLPDLFQGTDRIPRMLEGVWRRVLDDIMFESKGVYCHKDGARIQVFFPDIPLAVGKAKVDIARKKIPDVLKEVQSGKLDLNQPSEAEKKSRAPKQEQAKAPSDLEKMMKEGIGDNPTQEMMGAWCARAVQVLAMGAQKMPLTSEMVNLAAKSDIQYQPVWSASNAMIVGSMPVIRVQTPVAQYHTGETARQDAALLFSAVFQAYSVLSKGAQPLLVVPVRASSLNSKDFSELYATVLRKLAPGVQKSILIEFLSVPKDGMPPSLRAAIDAFAPLVRGYMFGTGPFAYADYHAAFPKLHGCSCDASDLRAQGDDARRLIKKYADHYSQKGVRTCIKSVNGPEIMEMAAKAEFSYIVGSAVLPPQKAAIPAQKMSLDAILKQTAGS